MGEVLAAELPELTDDHPSVGELRGLGLLWGLELVRDRETREPLVPYAASGEAAQPMAALRRAAMDRGLHLYVHGNVLLVAPPLIVGRDELATGLGHARRGPRRRRRAGAGLTAGLTLLAEPEQLARLRLASPPAVRARRPAAPPARRAARCRSRARGGGSRCCPRARRARARPWPARASPWASACARRRSPTRWRPRGGGPRRRPGPGRSPASRSRVPVTNWKCSGAGILPSAW